MKISVVTFPGSNCDQDVIHVARDLLGVEAELIWHGQHDLKNPDVVVLPGGFSYGDYLRAGAIARFSPIMQEVIAFANKGGPVIGICNGFQILCEAHLLPGQLVRNTSLHFAGQWIRMRVENPNTRFTSTYSAGQILHVPIAHGEGNFRTDPETLSILQGEGRVVFRYVNAQGERDAESNPNGAMDDIAGIINAQGNVIGLMPHPERAAESILGSTDGLGFFESLLAATPAGSAQ